MLLDSGASRNFIKKSFIDETSKKLFDDLRLGNDKSVKLADGSIIKTNLVLSNVNTQVKGKSFQTSFIVVTSFIVPQLNSGYDCILGMPYLNHQLIQLFHSVINL